MQIILNKENLSEVDCGGGLRDITAMITIDSSLPARRQREVAIHETVACFVDNDAEDRQEFVALITSNIIDVLDQLEALELDV